MPRVTEGGKRSPPLYGPIALFISTRKPRFTWISLRSSIHGTRNMITRSGSTMRSSMRVARYSGWRSSTRASESTTSLTAWWNSTSEGFLALTRASKAATYSEVLPVLGSGVITFDALIDDSFLSCKELEHLRVHLVRSLLHGSVRGSGHDPQLGLGDCVRQ